MANKRVYLTVCGRKMASIMSVNILAVNVAISSQSAHEFTDSQANIRVAQRLYLNKSSAVNICKKNIRP
jgi:hypothetical protein